MAIGKLGYWFRSPLEVIRCGASFNGQMTIGKLGQTIGDEYTSEAWFRSRLEES